MKSILSIAAVILLSLHACTPMKMAVHPDLRSSYDALPVKGRQGILIKQKMSFGAFNTNTVKRSWTKGSNAFSGLGYVDQQRMKWVNLIGTEYINRKQTVRFSLNNDSMQSDVFCVSKFRSADFRIGSKENSIVNIGLDIWGVGDESSSLYYVQIFAGKEDTAPWQLLLDNQESQEHPGKYIGKLLKNEQEYYTLHPVKQLEYKGKTKNMPFGSIGFEFRNPEGKTVAAVSMIDNGMVYLGKTTAAERFLLANACTAILLQEQIG